MQDIEMLPQVCIGYRYTDCKNMLNSYINENYKKIAYVNKYYPHMVRLHDGHEIYFMTERRFHEWCLGRIYRFYGDYEVYHSRHKVNLKNNSNL